MNERGSMYSCPRLLIRSCDLVSCGQFGALGHSHNYDMIPEILQSNQ